jgi:ABC-type glycerol-3-phosphate transport system substrate-binding protein
MYTYGYAILASTKYPQLAYNFIQFLATSEKYQLQFCMMGNVIPCLKSITSDRFFDTPEWKVYFDQMKFTKLLPRVSCIDNINQAIADAIYSVASGKATAKEALDAAAVKANALLAKE